MSLHTSFAVQAEPASAPIEPVLATAPHRIGRVALTVRDLAGVSQFYQEALGLELLEEGRHLVRLGAGKSVLLELRGNPSADVRLPGEAGLFHTAFLLPDRADLGAWLAHAKEEGLRLLGASDHLVSEAVYLADPEGNGIEIYVDRPSAQWPRSNGMINMPSEPLNLGDLSSAASRRRWSSFPAEGLIGHVHLQVGDIPAAEVFYGDLLGFDVTCRYPGGSFYGSGGYHHQLATNTWNSRGASVRSDGTTGLEDVEIVADEQTMEAVRSRLPARSWTAENALGGSLFDPWGTSISLRVQ